MRLAAAPTRTRDESDSSNTVITQICFQGRCRVIRRAAGHRAVRQVAHGAGETVIRAAPGRSVPLKQLEDREAEAHGS
jgi:hypothetical protein